MVDAARAVGIRYVEEYISSDVSRGVLRFTEKNTARETRWGMGSRTVGIMVYVSLNVARKHQSFSRGR